MNRLQTRIAQVGIWIGLITTSVVFAAHLLWIGITPKGFWKVPRIRRVVVREIRPLNSSENEFALPLGDEAAKPSMRISPTELDGVKIGDSIFVMDQMYFADNQPNVFRVTMLRIYLGYPLAFLGAFAFLLIRTRRLTSRAIGPNGQVPTSPTM